MIRGFEHEHPVWFGCIVVLPTGAAGVVVGIVAAAEGLSVGESVLLGAVGALLSFLLAVLLLGLGLRAWAWPGNRRRGTADRIREQIGELGVIDSLTSVIERASYASGQRTPPPEAEVQEWRRNDKEASEVSEQVLQPLQRVLRDQGQPHLAAQLSVGVAAHVDDSPAYLGLELRLLRSLVDQWQNGKDDSLFKIGRFGGTSARA